MKKIILVLFISLFIFSWALAFDWKLLHERADRQGLSSALSESKKTPLSLENEYVLGLVYLNLHKDNLAKQTFNMILSQDPANIYARWGVAEVLRRQHKEEESKKMLEEIIKEDKDFSPAYISLAYIKYLQLDFTGSLALANKVLEQGRENVDLSNFTRAYLLVAGGKGMLAHYGGPLSKIFNGSAVLPTLKKAQRLQPDSPAVLFGLGSFYFLAPKIAGGNIDKARSYLERAVTIDPFFADAYVRLSQVYRLESDNKKADEYLKKALKIDPQNRLAQDAKGKECKFICVTLER